MARSFGDWTRDLDTTGAFVEEIRRTAGMIDLCEWHIRLVAPESFVWGQVERVEAGNQVTVKEAAAVNAWVKLWQGERAHLVRVVEAAARAGISERQIVLEERMGAEIADVLRRFAETMGVASDPRAPAAMRAALSAVAGD